MDKISHVLNNFVGFAYEEIAIQYLKASPRFSDYTFGRWWNKEGEIDVVGLDNTKSRIIFGEIMWKNLSEKDARRVLNRLVEKSVEVKWGEREKLENCRGKNIFLSARRLGEK